MLTFVFHLDEFKASRRLRGRMTGKRRGKLGFDGKPPAGPAQSPSRNPSIRPEIPVQTPIKSRTIAQSLSARHLLGNGAGHAGATMSTPGCLHAVYTQYYTRSWPINVVHEVVTFAIIHSCAAHVAVKLKQSRGQQTKLHTKTHISNSDMHVHLHVHCKVLMLKVVKPKNQH